MYNKEMIFKQLNDMKAPRNSVVHIHTSLKAVGEVEGRGEGFLDILIEYFTAMGGILTIPTHTWENLNKNNQEPTLDLSTSYTCIGKLTEIAAAHKDAVRTLHPTHSMAVFGEKERVRNFAVYDEGTNTSTSPDGCYGQLLRENGYILLIGVGHDRNTYLHSVEEMLDVPDRLTQNSREVFIKKKDGTLIRRELYSHTGGASCYYSKYEKAFRKHSCVTDGFIGNAPAQLCSCVKMKDVLEMIFLRSGGAEILKNDREIDEALYM